MKIVTGYTGQPHVTSNAAQGFNQGIFGTGNYVLNVGNKFNAVLTDVNTVTISDGEGVLQGVHFRIDPGTTEDVNIANGTTGYKRIDYICARYTKNALTGVESVNLVVVEGTPAASTPTAPAINTGDVLLGGSPVDFPLYEVDLNGLTPTVSPLFGKAIGSVSKSISPPDVTKMSRLWSKTSVISEDRTITEDGWYAVYVYSSGGSAGAYIHININDSWQTVASVSNQSSDNINIMTPWIFFKTGTIVRFGGFGSSGELWFAPCID